MVRSCWLLVLGTSLFLACPGSELGDDDMADDDASDDDDTTEIGDDDSAGNHPPTAPTVWIDPDDPWACEELACWVIQDAEDPDGDPVSYTFSWELDGVPFPGATGDTVSGDHTTEGQLWTCTVVASDGVDEGEPGQVSVEIGPAYPCGWEFVLRIEATGGEAGGPATAWLENHYTYDCGPVAECTVSWQMDSTYTHGVDQGEAFWSAIDEVVTWTSAVPLANDCPPGPLNPGPTPVPDFAWWLYPMAFVSCGQLLDTPSLASTYLGMDDSGYIPTDDGTFGDYCATVGPAYQATLGTGPIEGIWLMPGIEGELDALGGFAYFPAEEPAVVNYTHWLLAGLLMADPANLTEPTPGLEGGYGLVPFWFWPSDGC